MTAVRPRNDLGQYDDLAEHWWRPDGAFAALHALAVARAQLIGPAPRPGAILVDVGCGAGLLAPHVDPAWCHVGVDLVSSALGQAAAHGVAAVRADAARLPLPDACADVVVAGEVLEHVEDLEGVVAEVARVCRPGGRVVLDTIAATRRARLLYVTVMERLPGGPPPRLHDPALFVDPARLRRLFARHGVRVQTRGLRATKRSYVRYLLDRDRRLVMVPTRSDARLYQGVGSKDARAPRGGPVSPMSVHP